MKDKQYSHANKIVNGVHGIYFLTFRPIMRLMV